MPTIKKAGVVKKGAKKAGAAKKAANQSTSLGQLPDRVPCDKTVTAQRFLDAAVASVRSALSTLDMLRDLRRTPQRDLPRGRLTDAEEDQLRSAVAFAGAGLDAALKQLIRDALPDIAALNSEANEKFHEFSRSHLMDGDLGVSARRLVEIFLTDSEDPWVHLLERYTSSLTGDSLQSAKQVGVVCTALGATDRDLRTRIRDGSTLDLMFRARNEMIHELDLIRDVVPGQGVRAKRTRAIRGTVEWAKEALSVAQEIINEVGRELTR